MSANYLKQILNHIDIPGTKLIINSIMPDRFSDRRHGYPLASYIPIASKH